MVKVKACLAAKLKGKQNSRGADNGDAAATAQAPMSAPSLSCFPVIIRAGPGRDFVMLLKRPHARPHVLTG